MEPVKINQKDLFSFYTSLFLVVWRNYSTKPLWCLFGDKNSGIFFFRQENVNGMLIYKRNTQTIRKIVTSLATVNERLAKG